MDSWVSYRCSLSHVLLGTDYRLHDQGHMVHGMGRASYHKGVTIMKCQLSCCHGEVVAKVIEPNKSIHFVCGKCADDIARVNGAFSGNVLVLPLTYAEQKERGNAVIYQWSAPVA